MADIQTKNFQALVADQVATIQGSSTGLVDFTIGSILRAIVEAYSAVVLWLQALILKVLALTRAATSSGADLDSWMADYGLVRLAAVSAVTLETFSRFTATQMAVIAVGTIVQTSDGSQQYAVIADPTNTAYNAGLGGYVIGAGVTSVAAPVQAITAGQAANASAGSINVLAQAIAGVDTVSNAAAVTNGEDAESDAAFRVRFVGYLASLSKATKLAVGYAVSSVENGIRYTLVENEDYSGAADIGYFYVVADDGSGSPSAGLISQIYAAVDAVRPIGSTFGVFPPVVILASAIIQLSVTDGYDAGATEALVETAVTTYIDGLPLGTSLSWSRLIQVAYDSTPGVAGISSLTLNGGMTDITVTAQQVLKAGSIVAAA